MSLVGFELTTPVYEPNKVVHCLVSEATVVLCRLLSKNMKTRKYKAIILPVVLYGCETWSLTLREKHRLRVF
jgi:hypothetical protein